MTPIEERAGPEGAGVCRRVAVKRRRAPRLAAEARARIRVLAQGIRRAEPRLGDIRPFGPSVRKGLGPGMAVIFGDAAEIRFLTAADRSHYDYRLAWLGCPGDLAVIGGAVSADFENYQRDTLGAPGLRYLHVETGLGPLRRPAPVVCLKDAPTYARLRAACAGTGAVTLLAHITTGTIWGLAARLAEDTGATVHVAGPTPRVTRLANDKIWFGEVAQALLGPAAIPEKRSAFSASSLTRHVIDLARRCDRIVLKVPDSAGGEGNLLVPAAALRGLAPGAVFDELRRRLAAFRNGSPFPLAVEVWETNVLASPSVQLWLPLPGDGPPVIEGIYEQILAGDTQAFVGATEAILPEAIDARLSSGAMQLALLFQALGYFGRCSFDAILSGPDIARARVQWVECNGRWGGVSIPMSLANRLPGDLSRPRHAIVQDAEPLARPLPFAEARRVAAEAEASGALPGRIVLLTPGPFETGRGIHLLALADSRDDALAASRQVIARLRDAAAG